MASDMPDIGQQYVTCSTTAPVIAHWIATGDIELHQRMIRNVSLSGDRFEI